MRIRGRLVGSSVALIILVAVGIVGYISIEGWSLLEAAYMTVLTFTTVGYKEVRPLSTGGRVFTMFLMIGGVGVMLYILTNVVHTVVEGEFLRDFFRRHRMRSKLAGLSNHLILCGYGRMGKEVARAFQEEGTDFIVVDKSPDAIAEVEEKGFLYVQGDATEEETLRLAGIERARGLVSALGSDSDNVFVTLTARGMKQDLLIVARAASTETEAKLYRAGADRVVSPYTIGGRRLAFSVMRPLAVDFFDTIFNTYEAGLRVTEVEVTQDSPLAGRNVQSCCDSHGVRILALKKRGGQLFVSPGDETTIEVGDGLIMVGTGTQLAPLEGKK